jgi:hypothetical protein
MSFKNVSVISWRSVAHVFVSLLRHIFSVLFCLARQRNYICYWCLSVCPPSNLSNCKHIIFLFHNIKQFCRHWYYAYTCTSYPIISNCDVNARCELFSIFTSNLIVGKIFTLDLYQINNGRSRNTRREPPTMGRQLVSFITCDCESSAPFL